MSPGFIEFETISDGAIARITLNRPEARNAQNRALLVELGEAFDRAEQDDRVRVVILRGAGPVFSAGHDLSAAAAREMEGPDAHPTSSVNGGTRPMPEKRFLQEWHYYFQNTLRWRDLRKITIAEVHGKVYSAGLMLAWACDLIVAAEETQFADVVATRMGMAGVEYFAHPWEFGPRRAKQLLLTGDAINADEAQRIGMVSKVFPADALSERTVEFAERIASVDSMAAIMIKESVNQSVNSMGFRTALDGAFTLHQLNHAYWAERSGGYGAGTPEYGIVDWRTAGPTRLSDPHQP